MAYTPLRISVPEPCHEDWAGMTPVDGSTARHCDSCAKNVVDFTGFSDAQLAAFTKENNNKICGRFRPDQLGRPLRANRKSSYTPLKIAATAAGLLLSATGLDAQQAPGKPTPDILERPEYPEIMGMVEQMPFPEPVTPLGHDTIVPENSAAVDTVISLPEVQVISYSAIKGRVAINHTVAPLELSSCDGVVFIDQSAPSEQTIQPVISAAEATRDTIIPLPPTTVHPSEMIMGEVYVETPRPTGLDYVLDSLKAFVDSVSPAPSPKALHPRPRPAAPDYLENFTVSPNPAREKIRISVNSPLAQTLELSWTDASGRVLRSQVWPLTAGENWLTQQIDFEPRHGIVFLRLTDERGTRATKPVVLKR
ncbi:T9SS type A sorting domain-containing protein [Neolewinella antarctica]|uniref:T9SS type A sorting domain-containing protein n=1 Tax=Neolewinella antarctica TaxID=442734 RepID=A0ABX0XD38_9BACT|nr:hypothetical protein [Neolewinella antarctica]NJC27117.1 hypothetical protein [Neolewinella antarctica]